jgi:hypothetical protein
MFTATRPFGFFDYFRVPYRLDAGPDTAPEVAAAGRRLLWPGPETLAPAAPPQKAGFRLGEIPLYARVLGAEAATRDRQRRAPAMQWVPGPRLSTVDGSTVSNVWTAEDGSIYLPFDPDAMITAYWSEAYAAPARARRNGGGSGAGTNGGRGGAGQSPTAAARWAYYRIRPLIPRGLQVRLRQAYTRVQGRTPFPRWPFEPALHQFYELLAGWVTRLAGEEVPYLAPWPDGHTWALVLTHDVETADGYRRIEDLRRLELARGYRSSWNFVPKRYDVEQAVVDELARSGFEVGVHGLHHDGRDLESRAALEGRLDEIRRYSSQWKAVGFRSPALQRSEELIPLLPFDYDSSYPDTDPYEPIPGGCCSMLPIFKGPLVELPITLAQDFVLFDLLQLTGSAHWLEKADQVRGQGGMALALTHPDYMTDPDRLQAYDALLAAHQDDPTCWHALPRTVAAWWRARAASQVVATPQGWSVSGPAAGAGRVATWVGGPAPTRREVARGTPEVKAQSLSLSPSSEGLGEPSR